MRPIVLGYKANGEPMILRPEVRQSTHMHVIGGSGKGKSKFLQWMIERDIREGNGLCLIDWHGTLYKDIVSYCSQLEVGLYNDFRSLILLNPSEPEYITGFNPFMNQGADVATQVTRRIDATIRPWGIPTRISCPRLNVYAGFFTRSRSNSAEPFRMRQGYFNSTRRSCANMRSE